MCALKLNKIHFSKTVAEKEILVALKNTHYFLFLMGHAILNFSFSLTKRHFRELNFCIFTGHKSLFRKNSQFNSLLHDTSRHRTPLNWSTILLKWPIFRWLKMKSCAKRFLRNFAGDCISVLTCCHWDSSKNSQETPIQNSIPDDNSVSHRATLLIEPLDFDPLNKN